MSKSRRLLPVVCAHDWRFRIFFFSNSRYWECRRCGVKVGVDINTHQFEFSKVEDRVIGYAEIKEGEI